MNEPEQHPPDLARRMWNFATAAVDFARDGFATVDEETYQARLAVCHRCDRRQEAICSECGCYIKPKAAGRAWSCPLDRWEVPDVPLLPGQFQCTLSSEDLPPEFSALAGSYALDRQAAADVAGIGHFRAVWEGAVRANDLGLERLQLAASEEGVTLRFLGRAGQETPLVWRRGGWTIPFLLTGPVPLERIPADGRFVTIWPA